MHRALLLLLSLSEAACDRGSHAPPPPRPTLVDPVATATAIDAAAGCTLPPVPWKSSAPARVVAIGDIHGDLAAAKSALKAAGAIDDTAKWIGGDMAVVQTGDILDRGDDERAIVDLFERLEGEAKAAGGALIVLNGNHELMNADGDFRYVTKGGATDFDADGGRRRSLGPGGTYAKKFAKHNAIAMVGDAVFSHAGVLGDWTTHVEEVNTSIRCYLDGQTREAPAASHGDDSPLWTRAVGMPEVDCSIVKAALASLGAKRMIVGHTVQQGGITSACDGALWRIDVGLAKLYDGPIEVLQIYPESKVLHGTR